MSAAAPARAKEQEDGSPAANVCTDEYAGVDKALKVIGIILLACMVGEPLWFLAVNVWEGML